MIRYIFTSKRDAYEFSKVTDIAPVGEVICLGENIPCRKDDIWVHIGYCKGRGVGSLIEPSFSCKEKEIIRIDSMFPIERRICVTGEGDNPSYIYDEGLFEIAKIPHNCLYAIKIVSKDMGGNSNHGKDGAWIRAAEMLQYYLSE